MHANIILWSILLLTFKKTTEALKIVFFITTTTIIMPTFHELSLFARCYFKHTHMLTYLILTQSTREELQLPSFTKSEERKFKQLSQCHRARNIRTRVFLDNQV